MCHNDQKSEKKRIIKEDFNKSLTHERQEPNTTAPTTRPTQQQESENQQQDTTSKDKE